MIMYILWSLHTVLEFLPISSSGHMQLISHIMHDKYDAYKYYYSMHITNAIVLAIFLLHVWFDMLQALPKTFFELIYISILIFIANSATGICYWIYSKSILVRWPLSIGFSITSFLLLSLFFIPSGISKIIAPHQALIIGFAQGCALMPGISRLASTYVVAYWLSIEPATAFIFSCTIEFALLLAGLAKAWYDISPQERLFPPFNARGILLLISASIASYYLLFLILNFAQMHMLPWFGVYMLLLSIVLGFMFHKHCPDNHRTIDRNFS